MKKRRRSGELRKMRLSTYNRICNTQGSPPRCRGCNKIIKPDMKYAATSNSPRKYRCEECHLSESEPKDSLELECRYCDWVSEGYSKDMQKAINEAKEHAKKHRVQYKYWAIRGKVILEMFTVSKRTA